MDLVQIVGYILSLLTLVSHVFIGIGVFGFFFFRKTFAKLVKDNSTFLFTLGFIVATVATSGSLFYSEIAKYDPCKLCWFQRIFMYPQVLLFGLALYKKERVIIDYVLSLSLIGFAIAFYHYLLQIDLVPSVVCDVVGYSVSCSQRFEMEYGYITIPMMSLTAFFIIAVSMMLLKKYKK